MFIFLTDTADNNVQSPNFGLNVCLPYTLTYSINNVYLTNGIGQQMNNGIKLDKQYKRYNIEEHFPSFSSCLEKISYGSFNNGSVYYINFCGDGEGSTFDNVYSGSKSFADSNYKLFFTPTNTNIQGSLILNVLFIVPAYLELQNGQLNEYYP